MTVGAAARVCWSIDMARERVFSSNNNPLWLCY